MKRFTSALSIAALLVAALPLAAEAAAPSASADPVTVLEDASTTVTLSAFDPDAGAITGFAVVDGPTKGTLGTISDPPVCDASVPPVCTATVTYTPDPDRNGADAFTFTATDDGAETSGPATAAIMITPDNDDPTAVDDTATVGEDSGPTTIDVLDNDTALPDTGETLTVFAVSDPGHGTAAVTPGDDAVTYEPDPDTNGEDTFTYTVSDGNGGGDTATVTVTVTAVDDPPFFTAGPDQEVLEDAGAQAVDHWATGISAGAPDEGGQPLEFEVTSNTNAALFAAGPAVAADGTLTYTPADDANGTATVAVRLGDGSHHTASQSFSIDVAPVNDAPGFTPGGDVGSPEDAGPQLVSAWATAITAGPPDEAGQILTFEATVVDNPGLFLEAPAIDAAGTLTYQPARNVVGTAIVQVTLHDDGGTADGGADASPTESFTITVEGANDPPIAANDLVTVRVGGDQAIDVLANDNGGPGEEGDPVTITSVREGSRGFLTITGDGTGLRYDPFGCTTGTDTFSYTLTDSFGATDTATVLVTIAGPAGYPAADGPRPSFVTGSKAGSTMPVRLTWCGVTSGAKVKSYRVYRSTNGGAFSTLISSTTSTSTTRDLALSPTTYQFKAKVSDTKSRIAYGTGPRFRVIRTTDRDAAIAYSPGWKTASSSKYLGGTVHYASSSGRTATFTYTGRSFALIGTKASNRGSFNVYVDGVRVTSKSVSSRSSTTQYRRVLYTRTLGYGTHIVKVVLSGNGRVDVDAFMTIAVP